MLLFLERYTLRVSSAYRTVSSEAALVVAGLVPFDLLADERERLSKSEHEHTSKIRVAERAVTMFKSQYTAFMF